MLDHYGIAYLQRIEIVMQVNLSLVHGIKPRSLESFVSIMEFYLCLIYDLGIELAFV